MIISAGAVGVVLETKEEVERRGVQEVVQVLGTHSFNTAKHPSQIDCDQFGHELSQGNRQILRIRLRRRMTRFSGHAPDME